jgi:aspartyl-tRNA(Asn)/glutamyl-tRNA(Gln) amidotransferase subunit C
MSNYDTLWCCSLLCFFTALLRFLAELSMALTLDDVKRVAHLARIAISDDEAQATQTQLAGIFKLIGEMEAVDVSAITPMSHAQDVVQRLREDAVTEPNLREQFQAIAPQVESGLYLVPRVIE